MPAVQLYPHDPSTLLPLLKAHLPNSLPVYGTILSNPSPPSPSTSPGTLEPLTTVETSSYLHSAWYSFPPTTLHNSPEPFVVPIHLPPPMSHQIPYLLLVRNDPAPLRP